MKHENPNIEHDAPDYEKYKAGIFESTKKRILNTLNGISQTSLKDNSLRDTYSDREMLINEIKTIVKNY